MANPSELSNLRWTKVTPPRIMGGLVRRDRVRERLERSLECPLTLVCAPAGYGKTTLLSDWLVRSGLPHAWLALDERDSDLASFLGYFVAAIHTAYPDACAGTLHILAGPELPPVERLATVLANDLDALPGEPDPAAGKSLILVLDDFHLVRDEAVHVLLKEIWRHPPRGVHLILSTRQDPPWPLHTLRARGELTEIRLQDLRFSHDEVALFMQQAIETPLDDQAITLLAERTEGWAAGLRLAAFTLATHDDIEDHLAEIPADNRYVMDYLMGEVLSHVPSATQDFLLKTSILNRLSGPLCDAVTGVNQAQWNGQAYLEWLAHEDLFTWSIDPQQHWYRYHHLFRRLLQNQLAQRVSPQEIAELHARASAWFAAHGFVDEALEHALAAGDTAGAIQLIEAHRHEAMNQEHWLDLQRWLEQLPRPLIDTHPELVLAEAWLLHHRAALADVPTCLARAEALLQQASAEESAHLDEGKRAIWRGEIATLNCQLSYWSADAERTLTLGRRALAETPSERFYVRGVAWMFTVGGLTLRGEFREAIAAIQEGLREDRLQNNTYTPRLLQTLCFAYWMAADLPLLLQTADHMFELTRELDLPESINFAQYFRGCAFYQQNDLDAAREAFAAVVAKRAIVNGQILTHSIFGQVMAYQAQGQIEPARATARMAVKYALEVNLPDVLAAARALAAYLALSQGREAEALNWAAQADRKIAATPMPLFYFPEFTLVEFLIHQGTPASLAEAERLLARLREVVQTTHNTRFLIEALALQALLHEARHEREAALETLKEAVTLAEPGGVIRVFVDRGPRLAALLRQLSAQGVAPGFVATLLDAFPPAPVPASVPRQPGLIEPLSDRELEVLGLLAQRLSNKEIAHALSISPMTVKRHSSNIYQKLAVESRRQAVSKAVELGIIAAAPPPYRFP